MAGAGRQRSVPVPSSFGASEPPKTVAAVISPSASATTRMAIASLRPTAKLDRLCEGTLELATLLAPDLHLPRVGHRDGGEQRLGVRVLRVRVHVLGVAFLDELALV